MRVTRKIGTNIDPVGLSGKAAIDESGPNGQDPPYRCPRTESFCRIRTGSRFWFIFALLVYVCITLSVFLGGQSFFHEYLGGGDDPIYFMWCLRWWPFSISQGHDPFWTHYVWFPHGFDLAWSTSIPVLAILAAPLTAIANATLSFNAITLAAPILDAFAGFVLARYVTRDNVAALISGYLFGFSSYVTGQMLAHLDLDLVFIIPLLVLLVVARLNAAVSRRSFIVLFALGLFAELGISIEIVATFCTLGAVVWAVFWIFGPKEYRSRLLSLSFEVVGAAFLLVFLAIPYIWALAAGAYTVPPVINSTQFFSADLLNFFVPTQTMLVGGKLAAPISQHFSGNASEQGAYLGIPLVVILAVAAYQYRHDRLFRALIIAIGTLIVASLGPKLHLTGHATGIHLPWYLTQGLPFIRSALPTRFTLYVALATSVAVAFWIARATGATRIARLAAGVIACVFLIPNSAMFSWSRMPDAAWIKDPAFARFVGPMPNIIVLPFGVRGPGMGWQVESHFRFTQSGGYVGFMPRQSTASPVIGELASGKPAANFSNDISAYCATHKVTALALAPDTSQALRTAIQQLNWRTRVLHGVTLVKVPPANTLDYYSVRGNYWPASGRRFAWIGRHATIRSGNRSLRVIVSGRYRPGTLPPVQVTVAVDGKRTAIRVASSTQVKFVLPPHGVMRLRAARTFRPDHVIHNGDDRELSVLLAIRPKS